MNKCTIAVLVFWLLAGCESTETESSNQPLCLAALAGWTVPDTSVVHLSADVPAGSFACSFVLHMKPGASGFWPYNSIYRTIIVSPGTYPYRLTFFGKKEGEMGGDVTVNRNRPTNANTLLIANLDIVDTLWTLYSRTDTVSTVLGDTMFVTISGGSGEYGGSTLVNSVRFERIY